MAGIARPMGEQDHGTVCQGATVAHQGRKGSTVEMAALERGADNARPFASDASATTRPSRGSARVTNDSGVVRLARA